MLRLVRNLALGAALLTVAVAVWRDYGTMVTLRRAIAAYLVTFFVGGGLGLLAVIGLQACRADTPPEADTDSPEPRANRRRRRASPGAQTPVVPDPNPNAETPATSTEVAAT